MKTWQKLLVVGIAVLVVFSIVFAEHFSTVYVRTLLHVYGKAVITDSARVQGNFLVNGNTVLVGTLTTSGGITLSDSLAVQTIVIGQGQNSYLYTLRSVQHGGGVTLSLDTLGNLIAYGKVVADDSLRSQGPFLSNGAATLVGAVTANDKLVVDDSIRSQGPTKLVGAVTVNSTITGSASTAKIDSFATTGATKVVYMPGASLGDVFVVSQYLPSYSATPDTGCAYGTSFQATDSVLITRTPTRADASLKSGGLFTVIKIDR